MQEGEATTFVVGEARESRISLIRRGALWAESRNSNAVSACAGTAFVLSGLNQRINYPTQRLRSGLVRASQHVDDLVLVESLELVACRTEVLPRVELGRTVHEDLADCRGHGKAPVGVDVDLAHR